MTRDQVLDDLSYIKSLAEQGAQAPLVGGPIGLMWGVLLCVTFFLQWTIISGVLAVPPSSLIYIWIAFAVIGGAGSAILGSKADKKPGANSVANQVETHVWIMFAGMMFTVFVGVLLNQFLSNGTVKLFDLMVIVGFAGQGMAYGIVARVSQLKWVHGASLTCFIASAVCFCAYGQSLIYLIGSFGMIFTVVIPSLISLKQEPNYVV